MKHFFVSAGVQHGNSIVGRCVSPGGIIIVLFWTKYAFPPQVKSGILKLTIRRGQSSYSLVFFLLAAGKIAIIVPFR